MNAKLIYTLLLLLFVASACTDRYPNNEEEGDGLVRLKATVAKNNSVTRADDDPQPATEGDYYLYYTPVIKTADTQNGMNAHTFTCDISSKFTADPLLYWDDIKRVGSTDATFYLTNAESMTFSPKKENKDILYGEAEGWNEELNFELEHLTSKITVVLYDNTLNKDVDFGNAKVVFYPGLTTKTKGINYKDGEILYDTTDKEKTTTIKDFTSGRIEIGEGENKKEYNCVTSENPLHIVPQEFDINKDSLEITAGKYVYRIPVPTMPDNKIDAGEHLTMYIELTEDKLDLTATLVGWYDVPNVKNINVSRVFNISNWHELKDLMQAINTGYTFKGMVVRLTKDITIKGQITLGTEENPFEGIFDGNNKSIINLGNYTVDNTIPRNKGGFFGYTNGATLQNITLEAPYIATDGSGSTGSLVNTAENTTIFNCKITAGTSGQSSDTGIHGASDNNVGGMVGIATGESTLINCYSHVIVSLSGTTGYEYIGGLVGYSEAAITHCCATGEVKASGAFYVGGLVGYQSGVMQYCYAQGDVTGDSQVGGLIGYLDGEASFSYASGDVGGSTDRGGLFGNIGFDGVADKCFWKHSSYGGAGSADLSKTTCSSFTDASDLYTKLNDAGIWKNNGNDYPTFEDMN
ncbi:hypothetical protein LJC21_01975 [Bacteroides sp. OttesenSCG-928-E20]|nr:hypothetical protein [Bacteroides sp. OttesenSCG-928-N06]MDL2299457.1 hypothetical protein [Bacteroides sp. OttesenSCG-928-E20]MDL2305099.1 hypothetical protein [Bacteroides sp. OttesenSCG-928-D19]